MEMTVNGRTLDVDEEGFLLNPEDWDEDVAREIAKREGIELTETVWELINYFREYYEDHMVHPTMHKVVLSRGKRKGVDFQEAEAYRDFLYELFPKGPIPTLCKLAGLPKPVEEIEE